MPSLVERIHNVIVNVLGRTEIVSFQSHQIRAGLGMVWNRDELSCITAYFIIPYRFPVYVVRTLKTVGKLNGLYLCTVFFQHCRIQNIFAMFPSSPPSSPPG